MRLRTAFPSVDRSVFEALDQYGIRTCEDLVFSNSPSALFHKLPQNTISFFDLNQIFYDAIEALSPDFISGDKLLKSTKQHSYDRRSSGVPSEPGIPTLGELIAGSPDKIIEISGRKGSGRTVLSFSRSP